MVHHLVLWNFKPELSAEAKEKAGKHIQSSFLALKDKISGIVSLEFVINEFMSSDKDIALISAFETEEALNAYQIHPAHVKAAVFLKTVTCDRVCLDYK